MVFRTNTGDNDYLFVTDRERLKYEQVEIDNLKRKRRNLDLDIAEQLRKKHDGIERWEGHDVDKDLLDDGMEIQTGLHTERNVPLHKPIKRFGPTTRGSAYVGKGSIVFEYDNSIIDMRVKPSHSVIGGVHRMKTPFSGTGKMKTSVDFGEKHNHVNKIGGFKIDLDVHPEAFRMNTDKIKNVGIRKLKVQERDPRKGIRSEIKEGRDDVNDLSQRLSGFVKKQKKSGGVDIIGGKNLDFSLVGITKPVQKKKIRGFEI